MVTQEQLNARRTAAQYIDNGKEYAAEISEIRQLQEILTPRPVSIATPMQEAKKSYRLKPANITAAEHLAEQCKAKLASGEKMKPDLVKFLTAMSQAH